MLELFLICNTFYVETIGGLPGRRVLMRCSGIGIKARRRAEQLKRVKKAFHAGRLDCLNILKLPIQVIF